MGTGGGKRPVAHSRAPGLCALIFGTYGPNMVQILLEEAISETYLGGGKYVRYIPEIFMGWFPQTSPVPHLCEYLPNIAFIFGLWILGNI